LFVAIGLMFSVIAYGVKFGDTTLLAGYAMGTPARMGPGFFPFWLGVILVVLGGVIAALGMRSSGGHGSAFPRFHWRPIFWVLGAVALFGVILKPVGMLVAGFLLVFIASLGSRTFNPRVVTVLGVGLVSFCALAFVAGLKLPIPLCPDLESVQRFTMCRA